MHANELAQWVENLSEAAFLFSGFYKISYFQLSNYQGFINTSLQVNLNDIDTLFHQISQNMKADCL